MTKWDTLLSGVTTASVDAPETSSEIGNEFGFLQIAMLVIFLVVFVVFVTATNKSSNANRVDTITQEVGTVVKKTVESSETVTESLKSEPSVDVPKLVKAKFSGKKMFDSGSPADFEDSAYGEFARSLESGRDMPDVERPVSHQSLLMNDQLAPMRDALRKSGKSLTQFMSETDAYVPDALIEAWDQAPTLVGRRETQILDDEERVIARDAFQTLPMKAAEEEAVMILREILAARTESAHRSITLPEMPDDQLRSIKHWASQVGPASKIAMSILDRI